MLSLFLKRWYAPFYLQILHGNYASRNVDRDVREQFNADVRSALQDITPKIASRLIAGHWRAAIAGSWFAGVKRFPECRSRIGDRLLASRTCYAGQSHAFAMACYADDASADYLVKYLTTYLPRIDCYYDQNWAMPALVWVDHQLGTDRAAQFIKPGGLWDYFTADKKNDQSDVWTIEKCLADFWRTMEYCRNHFMDCAGS